MRWLAAAAFVILLFLPAGARAGEPEIGKMLPAPACAEGWVMDGKAEIYDRESLSDRINGEAELYFPYGFDRLAFARYASASNSLRSFDADVYRMGSLLDAFGIFAGYRRARDADAPVGAEGTSSSSQFFFYKDRYFVRLQSTGSPDPGTDVFLSCARAIADRLPGKAVRPEELEMLAIAGLERKSERYIAQSLLGYDFFRRGLMAEARLTGESEQLFMVPEDSIEKAKETFKQYTAYLQASGKNVRTTAVSGRVALEAVDPLYGSIYAEQTGSFVIGAVRIRNMQTAKELVLRLRIRIPDR